MSFSAAKKKGKKGKTLTLTDFLAEDSGGNPVPNYTPTKPTSWADETDDVEGDGECSQKKFIVLRNGVQSVLDFFVACLFICVPHGLIIDLYSLWSILVLWQFLMHMSYNSFVDHVDCSFI